VTSALYRLYALTNIRDGVNKMINIIHQLRMAKGSLAKQAILREHTENEDWKTFLKLTYDESINYYISAPADNTFVPEVNFHEMVADLTLLSNRTYTGNAARDFARQGSRNYGELFRIVLDGSLKAGVSTTSINKAYPNLISVFKMMLAKDVEVVRFPCIISTKYDGVRLLAFVYNDVAMNGPGENKLLATKVVLKLRSGKVIYIKSLVEHMAKQPPGVYDGELVSGDGLQAGRTTITGQVNKCLRGTATDITDYTFCIFDLLTHQEWDTETCDRPYQYRLKALHFGLEQSSSVIFAAMATAYSVEEVNARYLTLLSHGYEGLIVRYLDDSYTWDTSSKRSGLMVKKKATNECVLECWDVTEGTGKYEGMIGALHCRGEVDGKEVKVKLGSGLSDRDREQEPNYFIGKSIDVLYNDITLAKGSMVHSLFLPRFKRIAGDYNV